MAAAVLWLLRLAGPTHRGRALGHIGLANYAGLAVGPPLARLVGAGHPARVLVLAASLPLLAAALAASLRSRHGASARAARPTQADSTPSVLLRVTARPGFGTAAGQRRLRRRARLRRRRRVRASGAPRRTGGAPLRHRGDRGPHGPGLWTRPVGAARTLGVAVLAEATGLVGVALASTLPVTVSALVLLALGQGLCPRARHARPVRCPIRRSRRRRRAVLRLLRPRRRARRTGCGPRR